MIKRRAHHYRAANFRMTHLSAHHLGFTLLEVLLMVVLMSLMALAVVQTLPQNQADEAKLQAARLYQRLQLLSDDAILNGRDYGLRFEQKKSQFDYMRLTGDGWKVIENSKIYVKTALPDGLKFSFKIGSDAWSDKDRLFNSEDFYEDHFEDKEKQAVKPPQVLILSSGEVTPFEVYFITDDQDKSRGFWRVIVSENGEIHYYSPEQQVESTSSDTQSLGLTHAL